LRLGSSEIIIRFFLELIPSIMSVFLIYLTGKEMYGKRVGIIAVSMFSVLWIHLFYTGRLLTEVPLLLPLLFGVYYFVKANKDEFNYKYFFIALFSISIATLVKYTNGIFFFALLIMLIVDRRFVLLKKSKFWLYGILGLSPMLIFFIVNFMIFGNIFPAFFGNYLSGGSAETKSFGLQAFYLMPGIMQTTFFILFLLGLGIALFELVISYDLISKSRKLSNNLLLILVLILVLSFLVFYLKAAEDRWLYPIIIYSKPIGFIIIIAIFLFGAYGHFKYADLLIKDKKQSFLQLRQGFEWIEKNTPADAVITGEAIEPYDVYYSERKYIILEENLSNADEVTSNADYLVIHGFTPQVLLTKYLQNETNQKKWSPVQAFYVDKSQKQPLLVIYKKNNG